MIRKNEPLTPSPRDQVRVLFVCLGNICRSPMAEFIFKNRVNERGLSESFLIASAATSDEECWNGVGSPVYPPAKKELARHGIGVPGNELGVGEKHARQLRRDDYGKWDYIIGMERRNISAMRMILGSDPEDKIKLMLEFTDTPGDISDPWYTGDFEGVYAQITAGCEGFLKHLVETGKI